MPPKYVLRFFRWFCRVDVRDYIEGDLVEEYNTRRKINGAAKANAWFIIQVILLFRPSMIRSLDRHYSNSASMISNYFKISTRVLLKNKGYSVINIVGLSTALIIAILITVIVHNELSYDEYHAFSDRIYRVTINGKDYNPSSSFSVAPLLRNDFPELEAVSQYYPQSEALLRVGQTLYKEENFAYADESFGEIFNLQWITGDAASALSEPNSIVLTESLVKKFHLNSSPLGQLIRFQNNIDLQVTGVIKDLPSNTHLKFNFLVSWETMRAKRIGDPFWNLSGGIVYIVIPEHTHAESIGSRLPGFVRKNWGDAVAAEGTLLLQPLKEIHFDRRYGSQDTISRQTIYALAAIAIFVMAIACINFINLSVAQSFTRTREMGIRKTMGAYRSQLIKQVLSESILLVSVSLVIALSGVTLFLPFSERFIGIHLDLHSLSHPLILSLIACTGAGTVIATGLYPALVQTALQPAMALKSKVAVADRSFMRKSLIVIQFAISQALMIGAIVVGSQIDFLTNKEMGFDKDGIITMPAGNNVDVLRQNISTLRGVEMVSFSSGGPSYNAHFAPFSSPEMGMNDIDVVEIKHVDENYLTINGLELLAGEPIHVVTEKDTIPMVVVNETLMKRIGISDPEKAIGKHVTIGRNAMTIMGIVRDFQSESKHKKIRPCIIWYNPKAFWQTTVKLKPQMMAETIPMIQKIWTDLNPDDIFQFEFIDDHLKEMYNSERKTYNAFMVFSIVAVTLCSLGLFGLVALMTAQRTKEIGVRKVLGASTRSIVMLFFSQFGWLIALAFVVAVPTAWYLMSRWLEEFAYHVAITHWVFEATLLATVSIAAGTISYQSIHAALANPVESLRSE